MVRFTLLTETRAAAAQDTASTVRGVRPHPTYYAPRVTTTGGLLSTCAHPCDAGVDGVVKPFGAGQPFRYHVDGARNARRLKKPTWTAAP